LKNIKIFKRTYNTRFVSYTLFTTVWSRS